MLALLLAYISAIATFVLVYVIAMRLFYVDKVFSKGEQDAAFWIGAGAAGVVFVTAIVMLT